MYITSILSCGLVECSHVYLSFRYTLWVHCIIQLDEKMYPNACPLKGWQKGRGGWCTSNRACRVTLVYCRIQVVRCNNLHLPLPPFYHSIYNIKFATVMFRTVANSTFLYHALFYHQLVISSAGYSSSKWKEWYKLTLQLSGLIQSCNKSFLCNGSILLVREVEILSFQSSQVVIVCLLLL